MVPLRKLADSTSELKVTSLSSFMQGHCDAMMVPLILASSEFTNYLVLERKHKLDMSPLIVLQDMKIPALRALIQKMSC